MLKEWPLIAFTILGQTAVGVFWLFHLPFLAGGRAPGPGWRASWLIILGLVAALMALATLASIFHLHHPFRARRALGNLRTSWLSREILFDLAFLVIVASVAVAGAFGSPGPGLRRALLAAGCAAGGFFLLSMTKLYMLPTVPAWRGVSTPLAFLATTLVAGAVVTELAVRIVAGPGVFPIDLTLIAAVLIAGEIALTGLSGPGPGRRGVRPAPSLRPPAPPCRVLHRVRPGLLVAGLVFIVIDRTSGSNNIMNERGAGPALWLAFVFVLAAEVVGRFLFYGLVPRSGD
jgi:anaerobic dimethyl sulfoxide reductase subunit C (anchor subunit)